MVKVKTLRDKVLMKKKTIKRLKHHFVVEADFQYDDEGWGVKYYSGKFWVIDERGGEGKDTLLVSNEALAKRVCAFLNKGATQSIADEYAGYAKELAKLKAYNAVSALTHPRTKIIK